MKLWRSIAAAAGAVVLLALLAVLFLAPAAAAYVCPNCYGLEEVDQDVFIDRGATKEDKDRLRRDLEAARKRVSAYLPIESSDPRILVCVTRECDRRLGGRGARATAYGATFIHVSPRGLNETILAHELAHIAFHDMVGLVALARNRVPPWFDEGLAVVVSGDPRYLDRSGAGEFRCKVEPKGDLPATWRAWGRAAGTSDRPIYAEAACRVLRWLEGKDAPHAIRAAVSEIRSGGFDP